MSAAVPPSYDDRALRLGQLMLEMAALLRVDSASATPSKVSDSLTLWKGLPLTTLGLRPHSARPAPQGVVSSFLDQPHDRVERSDAWCYQGHR